MALSAVNASINVLVYQTKIDTISAFKEFLLEESEIDKGTLVTLFDKFKEKISVDDVAKKAKVAKGPKAEVEKAAKRAPTPYNTFVSLQMKVLKVSMARAQAVWRQLKVDNPDIAKNGKALLLKYQEETEENVIPLVESSDDEEEKPVESSDDEESSEKEE